MKETSDRPLNVLKDQVAMRSRVVNAASRVLTAMMEDTTLRIAMGEEFEKNFIKAMTSPDSNFVNTKTLEEAQTSVTEEVRKEFTDRFGDSKVTERFMEQFIFAFRTLL